MIIFAYILLVFCIFIYISAIVSVWEQRNKERKDWNKFWDDVFENNKNK